MMKLRISYEHNGQKVQEAIRLEKGKGLKKGPETFLKFSKTCQVLFQGPCSEPRAKIKTNQPEITKDQGTASRNNY